MEKLAELFFIFLKIGLFSIGGGYAVIPMIQKEIVEKSGFITEKMFTDIITISQMTPGPLAVNTSTFVGIQLAGIPGAVLATAGCVLAGICISILLFGFFIKNKESAYVFEVLRGLKASSLGLIMSAAVMILLSVFTIQTGTGGSRLFDYMAAFIFTGAFIAVRKGKMNPVCMLILTGIAGGVLYGR